MDAYLIIANVADSESMRRRIASAASQQGAPGDPWEWAVTNRYSWASAPGWGAAWDSALASHPDDPAYDPGADSAVITDGMILSQIQSMLGARRGK